MPKSKDRKKLIVLAGADVELNLVERPPSFVKSSSLQMCSLGCEMCPEFTITGHLDLTELVCCGSWNPSY